MVLDTDWYCTYIRIGIFENAYFLRRSPFNDSLVASSSDDGKVKMGS